MDYEALMDEEDVAMQDASAMEDRLDQDIARVREQGMFVWHSRLARLLF